MGDYPKTWVTATTYGAVFTVHSEDRKLTRLFLNTDALDELFSESPHDVIQSLREKGLEYDTLRPLLDKLEKDRALCDTLQKENGWRLFSLYPLQVSIQILNYCNAGCDFCYAGAPDKTESVRMGLSDIKKIKDYAAEHGVKTGMSGGEPTLHPEIFDILAYRSDEVFDTLITNLSTDIDLTKLADTGVDLVQISIHGHRSYHDRVLKIDGLYSAIFKRMKALAPRVNLATNTVVTPGNIGSIPDLICDLADFQDDVCKPLEYARFVPVMESGTGMGRYPENAGILEDFKSLAIDMIGQFPGINFEVPLLHPNPYEYFTEDGVRSCPAGSTVCVVRADGRVAPCNQFIETGLVSASSLSQTNFHDIWLNDPMLSKIRQGISIENDDAGCDECAYLLLK